MTITGKCDTCRQRKVKCDEQKPKCSACQKRDRTCTYSFGKVSAFVAEDPTQLSKHGKAKVAPLVYPLVAFDRSGSVSHTSPSPCPSSLSSLRSTSEREADDGQGVFLTLAVPSQSRPKGPRKPTAQQRKKLDCYLSRLKSSPLSLPAQITTPENALASRYLEVLGGRPLELQPLAILGSWIASIPTRLGSNPAVDLAVEYFTESFAVWQGSSFSKRTAAMQTRGRALKELQRVISDNAAGPTYDVVLAMKLHFAAEIFMGVKNLYHAIHAAALTNILKHGTVSGVDEEHYRSLVDNIYIDDVMESLIAGRTSLFENQFYLEMSSPSAIPPDATPARRAETTMMHVFIQMPRLAYLVRHVIENPEDMASLASAVSLAETLWMLEPAETIEQVLKTSTTIMHVPPSREIRDIIPDSYDFDSVQTIILVCRYWMLVVTLCGLTESLYLHFPEHAKSSLLPDLATVYEKDIDAAINMARCVRYSADVCPSLPILPLRVHTTFQLSIACWYRLICRLEKIIEAEDGTPNREDEGFFTKELDKARRMEDWVIDECNRIHGSWSVHSVPKKFLRAAVVDMSGGPIPEWLPTRVKFAQEGEHMVMKLEYDVPGPKFAEMMGYHEDVPQWTRKTTTASPFDSKRWIPMNPAPTG